MIYFDDCGLFLESRKSLRDKIIAIDQVIAVVQSSLLRAASGADVTEYQLNDGQTIIKVTNRGVQGITASLQALRILRQDYINQGNGRVFRAMDSKNFPNNYGGQF